VGTGGAGGMQRAFRPTEQLHLTMTTTGLDADAADGQEQRGTELVTAGSDLFIAVHQLNVADKPVVGGLGGTRWTDRPAGGEHPLDDQALVLVKWLNGGQDPGGYALGVDAQGTGVAAFRGSQGSPASTGS